MRNKFIAALTAVCMTAAFLPIIPSAAAEDSESGATGVTVGDLTMYHKNTDGYSYSEGNHILTIIDSGEYTISGTTTQDCILIASQDNNTIDVTLTLSDLSITNSSYYALGMTDKCNVTIILEGDNTLISTNSSYAGLQKNGTTGTLTITSADGDGSTSGKLTATGGEYSAGIGGGNEDSVSNIIIDGGTIAATGGSGGAGIGSGNYAAASNITINGGHVTAVGGTGGAGIGGGSDGAASNITINGGHVTAHSEQAGAGIGGGNGNSASGIKITGGYVDAYCEHYGAGIGGGYAGNGSDIEISGGTVIATGYYGAGIGGGQYGTGSSITISSASVTAESEFDGAGIGGGKSGEGSSITISDGTVKATAKNGAGIGGGEGADGSSITINGGKITLNSSLYGAGIGGGNGGKGSDISVGGGYIFITTSEGSPIGGGYGGSAGTITITGGCFDIGDVSAQTICGVAVPSGYKVYDNTDTATNWSYPYIVVGDSVAFVVVSGGKYTYTDNVLKLYENTSYVVHMNTYTGISSTDTARIEVTASDNVTVTISDLDITSSAASPFNISGNADVTLILSGDNTLTSTASGCAGLQKSVTDSTLTITSASGDGSTDGSLTATGSEWGAGIGGNTYTAGNNIIINGGTITAKGNNYSAGIGGGFEGAATNITISGGEVTAHGGFGSAGIGGGGYNSGTASNIMITGGTVTATGGTDGSGIGSGQNAAASDITITDGTVIAKGGSNGAAIGAGQTGSASGITITGGYITATAGSDASIIGAGSEGSASDITIIGGYYAAESAATGGYGTGVIYGVDVAMEYIVCENDDEDTSDSYPYKVVKTNAFIVTTTNEDGYTYTDNVLSITSGGEYTITMNTADGVTATALDVISANSSSDVTLIIDDLNITSDTASPITIEGEVSYTIELEGDNTLTSNADRHAGLQKQSYGTLTICNADKNNPGSLTATGGPKGAGIGGNSGWGSYITIDSGTITATGGEEGAGIGGNYTSDAMEITINGGTVTAIGGYEAAGIGGGGNKSAGSSIYITGGEVTAIGGEDGAGIGGGYQAAGSDINISGGRVTATGSEGGAGIGGGYNGKGSNITISGGTVTATGGQAGESGGTSTDDTGTSTDDTDTDGTDTSTSDTGGEGIGHGYGQSTSNVQIYNASVKASSIGTDPTASDGETVVYMYEIPNTTEGDTIKIGSDTIIDSILHHSDNDTNQYLYLPSDTTSYIHVGTELYEPSFVDEKTVITNLGVRSFTVDTAAATLTEVGKDIQLVSGSEVDLDSYIDKPVITVMMADKTDLFNITSYNVTLSGGGLAEEQTFTPTMEGLFDNNTYFMAQIVGAGIEAGTYNITVTIHYGSGYTYTVTGNTLTITETTASEEESDEEVSEESSTEIENSEAEEESSDAEDVAEV